uniref:Uncharacterized protein n=1 Tax=Peronospora matthiolae TaxID=2874970 RepID=A0AAV1UKC8_9STRA
MRLLYHSLLVLIVFSWTKAEMTTIRGEQANTAVLNLTAVAG